MSKTILLTGRAVNTSQKFEKSCYFCGRHENSLSLTTALNNINERLESKLTPIILRVASSFKHNNENIKTKYLICAECDFLFGLSPRLFTTKKNNIETSTQKKMTNQIKKLSLKKLNPKEKEELINCIKETGLAYFIDAINKK